MYRALKNVMKQKSEELILDKSFNKLINYIKRKPSNSEQQVKELISCLLYKLGNSFGELSKIQKTQAVAQVIRFILKNKAFIALNSIKSKQHEGISIKKCIKDIKEFEEYNTHFNADGRKYFYDHIVTVIGKALFNAWKESRDLFWEKAIGREGTLIQNIDYHKEKIFEKISKIPEIIYNSEFI